MTYNIIGDNFEYDGESYHVFKGLVPLNRRNGDVYLCENGKGKKFVAKYFYHARPMPVVAYGKYNHYGRRRDGSHHVFYEIQNKSKQFDFLIDHYFRIRHKGKWLILIEYIEGETLEAYFSQELSVDQSLKTTRALAETLAVWHRNGFAHGDPHLVNAIYTPQGKVILIDYCQLHHKDFKYCKGYCCLDKNGELISRIREDLENDGSNLGGGFKACLRKRKDGEELVAEFDRHYQKCLGG